MITSVRRDTLERFPKLKEVAFSNNSAFNSSKIFFNSVLTHSLNE
jgi:hypothetical protein